MSNRLDGLSGKPSVSVAQRLRGDNLRTGWSDAAQARS
jgi:hypothetical protein